MRRTLLSSLAVVFAVGLLAAVAGLGGREDIGSVATTNAAVVPMSTGVGSSVAARFESRTELAAKPGKGLWLVAALLASPIVVLVGWWPHRRLELIVTGHASTTRATTRAPPSLRLARP